MKNKFNFSVLCKTKEQVRLVLNSNENNNTVFLYKDGFYYWYDTCLGVTLGDLDEDDYGYEFRSKNEWDGDGDIEGYCQALFKDGHSIFIIFKVNESGKIYEWAWGDYIGDWVEARKFYNPISMVFDEFSDLSTKLLNSGEVTEDLIISCETSEKVSNSIKNHEIEKSEKDIRETKYKEEIKELEQLIDTSFVKDCVIFIKIEGHGYTKSIRKNSITLIEIKAKEVSKEEEDYFECEAGEFLGDEVLIYINGKTDPIKIHFSTTVYWPNYEDDLAKRFYNKLMNDINWD